MLKLHKRPSAKRDLIAHYVYLTEQAGLEKVRSRQNTDGGVSMDRKFDVIVERDTDGFYVASRSPTPWKICYVLPIGRGLRSRGLEASHSFPVL